VSIARTRMAWPSPPSTATSEMGQRRRSDFAAAICSV